MKRKEKTMMKHLLPLGENMCHTCYRIQQFHRAKANGLAKGVYFVLSALACHLLRLLFHMLHKTFHRLYVRGFPMDVMKQMNYDNYANEEMNFTICSNITTCDWYSQGRDWIEVDTVEELNENRSALLNESATATYILMSLPIDL